MKQGKRIGLVLLAACMLAVLCSCGSLKVKPEKINTKDYSRTIQVSEPAGSVEIVHSDKTSEAAGAGVALKSDDSLRVGEESELVLDLDGTKQVYAQSGSALRLEASGKPEQGKTRICLEEGSVICGLDETLKEGELFEVQTSGGTVSAKDGIFRVTVIEQNGVQYTLVEVLEGEAKFVINATGEETVVKAGEAVMVEAAAKKEPRFVLSDEIDSAFWNSAETAGMSAVNGGIGSKILPIPYSKMPAAVVDQLIRYADSGRSLAVSADALRNVRESGHDFAETVVAEATCTEAGKLSLVCNLCGLEDEAEIPALGHTEEELAAVEPDCENEGMTAGSKCGVCGEILAQQEVIPALGHTEKVVPGFAAKCEKDGLSNGAVCTVCGKETAAQEVIPALGHTEYTVPGRAVTCTRPGLTDGIRCSVCNKWIETQKMIATHSSEPEIVPAEAPTCEKDGHSEYTRCSVCGLNLSEPEVIPAVGHSTVTVPGREPTCSRPGLTDGERCTVCNKMVEKQNSIPTLAHTPETIPGKESTCTEAGLSDGSKCSVCGKILTAQKELPLAAHHAVKLAGKEPTCTKEGLSEGSKCADCGVIIVEQMPIAKAEHTPVTIPGRESTCSRPGLTDGERCSVCRTLLTAQKTIPALAHTSEIIPGKAATCYREGVTDEEKCSVCGYVIKAGETIPALPHTPGGLMQVDATCTSTGKTGGWACQICGEILKAQEKIEKKPHKLEKIPAVEATCTEDGLTEGEKCSACGLVKVEQVVIPAHHCYGAPEIEINPEYPALGADGYPINDENHHDYCYRAKYTCTVCGEKLDSMVVRHISGNETRTEVADGVKVDVACAYCGKIIHTYKELPPVAETTAPEEEPAAPAEETVAPAEVPALPAETVEAPETEEE